MSIDFGKDWEKERFVMVFGMKERVMMDCALRFYQGKYLPQMREHVDELPYGLSEIDDMEETIEGIRELLHKQPEKGNIERLVAALYEGLEEGSRDD